MCSKSAFGTQIFDEVWSGFLALDQLQLACTSNCSDNHGSRTILNDCRRVILCRYLTSSNFLNPAHFARLYSGVDTWAKKVGRYLRSIDFLHRISGGLLCFGKAPGGYSFAALKPMHTPFQSAHAFCVLVSHFLPRHDETISRPATIEDNS